MKHSGFTKTEEFSEIYIISQEIQLLSSSN